MGPIHDKDKRSKAPCDPASPDEASEVPATARDYYNAPSTDSFYHSFWGGEDIHIGTYIHPSDTIPVASQRTVSRMAALAAPITSTTRVLDLGAGYGGAARWLARQYGCKVTCVNISEVQNKRNREKTREQGLEALVEVIDGSFQELPLAEGTFDLVWCQDCLIHASDRNGVVNEITRVTVSHGASVVLTDHMATQDADPERTMLIKKRLSLDLDLATRQYYQDAFLAQGFEDAGYVEGTEHMITHCGKVSAALQDAGHLAMGISEEYAQNARMGMSRWIEGGKQGQLEWGMFLFRR